MANDLMVSLGLPEFTVGKSFSVREPKTGRWQHFWTGARVTRIDVTANFFTGSHEASRDFLFYISGLKNGRLKQRLRDDGCTVEFGAGSKYIYGKLYIKYVEFVRHLNKNKNRAFDKYLSDLQEWLYNWGVVRFELELKSRFLTQNQLTHLADINMAKIVSIYRERTEFLGSGQAEIQEDAIGDILPSAVYGTYCKWRDGGNPKARMNLRTWQRHRKAVLDVLEVDMEEPCNVKRMALRVKTISLEAATVPDWYWQGTTAPVQAA